MNWERGPYGRSYTVTTDIYQAMIWKTTTGTWSALVSQHKRVIAHNTFSILKDAQAWCEARLAEIVAGKQSNKDRTS